MLASISTICETQAKSKYINSLISFDYFLHGLLWINSLGIVIMMKQIKKTQLPTKDTNTKVYTYNLETKKTLIRRKSHSTQQFGSSTLIYASCVT